ncbi:hypothetical protein RclHR1_00850009 [Rhizophagus clarus]|uniref:Uncharacterized protein n=1 Tax=Rhizophagus clarus TaxID=94130 RepID=A0A2Z6S0M9_9GLOM|nr:hypothetical protein RclHR1_00850009 [Rhizophagus clarus]
MCKKKTDKDPEYLQTEEYKAPFPKKTQINNNILQVGNYSYILRNDVFYSGKELKQLELDFQEILEHITIPNEVSLSNKIIKMSNVLYNHQHKLNQKPIYNPTTFKTIKKLVSLCYFLASINNKYINSIKADIGSYLQTSGASPSSIDTLANIGFSITRKTVNRQKNLILNEHQQTVNDYCLQNIEKMFVLNIDDYHNIRCLEDSYENRVENLNVYDYDGLSLCYFLASINNKYINSIKADIESYLQTFGISPSSIDTLANIGFSITRKIVNRQKNLISNEHQQTVNDYCLQNIEKMFVLNIDDYHNIHFRNMPSLLETHNIFHFVTILLNSNSNITTIPYCSNNILIHNPKEIDSKLIIKNFENFFMKQIGKSYYKQNKLWKQFLVEDSYENRVENLNVHDYDGRIQNHQELRSLNNSKLVDFILHLLHSTKDYIECLNILFKIFERSENEYNYLDNYVIPIVADWPE